MNAPALSSARRPGSRCAFHMGHAWIICGHISSVTGTSAAPAASGKAGGVVEKGLGGADLDQHRRKAG